MHNHGLELLLDKQEKSADLSIILPVGGTYHNKVECQIHYHITHPVEQHLKDVGTAM